MIVDKKNNQKKAGSFALTCRNKSARRGFSLIEVLVTLLILTVSITGVTFLMAKNIASVQNSKNQIIAAMLAQEGIELIRNLKDNKNVNLDGLAGEGASYERYILSRELTDLNGPYPSNSAQFRLRLINNFFQHTGGNGTNTKFYRRIDFVISGKISDNPSTREITVTSYVTWNDVGFGGLDNPVGNLANNCTTANKCVSTVSVMPDIY